MTSTAIRRTQLRRWMHRARDAFPADLPTRLFVPAAGLAGALAGLHMPTEHEPRRFPLTTASITWALVGFVIAAVVLGGILRFLASPPRRLAASVAVAYLLAIVVWIATQGRARNIFIGNVWRLWYLVPLGVSAMLAGAAALRFPRKYLRHRRRALALVTLLIGVALLAQSFRSETLCPC